MSRLYEVCVYLGTKKSSLTFIEETLEQHMKGEDYSAERFCGDYVVYAVYATCCGHFLYLMLAGY